MPTVLQMAVASFGERCGDVEPTWGVDAEFVVCAAQVLHECVSGDDRLRGPVGP